MNDYRMRRRTSVTTALESFFDPAPRRRQLSTDQTRCIATLIIIAAVVAFLVLISTAAMVVINWAPKAFAATFAEAPAAAAPQPDTLG